MDRSIRTRAKACFNYIEPGETMSTANQSYLSKNKDLYTQLFLRVTVDDETDQLASCLDVEHPVFIIVLP